jgi:hypothetical protein
MCVAKVPSNSNIISAFLQQSRKFRVKKCNKTIDNIIFGEFRSHLLSNFVCTVVIRCFFVVRNNHFPRLNSPLLALSLSPPRRRRRRSHALCVCFSFFLLKFIKLRELEIDIHMPPAY